MSGSDVVVIAADGSAEASKAFDWYQSTLHKPETRVVVCHALEVPSMPTRDAWEQQNAASTKKKTEIQELFSEKMKTAGMKGTFVCEHEKPGQLLVEVATKEGATYVVMGTRGLGKLRRTVMGSVSDYVVHHAKCPVIVYRQ